MESQAGIQSPKIVSEAFGKKYWAVIVMFLLMAACWIPYFLASPSAQGETEYFLQWAAEENGGVALMVDTSKLATFKGKRVMAVSVVADPSVDIMSDTRIAKSRTYEIESPAMEINLDPTPSFLAREQQGGNVQTFLLLIPEDFAIERLTQLSDVALLGGKILEHRGYILPPKPQAESH